VAFRFLTYAISVNSVTFFDPVFTATNVKELHFRVKSSESFTGIHTRVG